MGKINYYEILGITFNASSKEITSAYRKLALNYHPDRNKNPTAEEMMTRINTAYGILSDPKKRREYDTHLFSGTQQSQRYKYVYRTDKRKFEKELKFLVEISHKLIRIGKKIFNLIKKKIEEFFRS